MADSRDILFVVKARDAASKSFKAAGAGAKKMGNDVQKAGNQAKVFSKDIDRVKTGLGGLKSALGAFVGVAAFKTMTDSARAFEASLQQTVALTNASAAEVAGFRSEILKIGPAVGKGPQELADAMFVVSSAGLKGAQALEALTVAAKGSASGFGETSDIARLIAASLFNWSDGALTVAGSMDILIATGREGNFAVSELSASMGRVLPVAKAMGVSFDEVGGAIAVLTKGGLPASEAVSLVTAALAALNKPGTETDKKFAALAKSGRGVSTSMAAIQDTLRRDGLLAALDLLWKGAGKSTSALQEIVGSIEAVKVTAALVTGDIEGVAASFDAVKNSAGAAATAFEVVSQTADQKMKRALSSMSAQLIELGGETLPATAAALEFLAKNLDIVASLMIGIATTYGAKFALAVGAQMLGSVLAFTRGIVGATAAMASMRAAMVLTPWGVAATAIGAVVGGLTLLHSKYGILNSATERHGNALGSLADAYKAVENASKDTKDALLAEAVAQEKALVTSAERTVKAYKEELEGLEKSLEGYNKRIQKSDVLSSLQAGALKAAQDAAAAGTSVGKAYKDAVADAGLSIRDNQLLFNWVITTHQLAKGMARLGAAKSNLNQILDVGLSVSDSIDFEDSDYGKAIAAAIAREQAIADGRSAVRDKEADDASKIREKFEEAITKSVTAIEAETYAISLSKDQKELFNAALAVGIDLRDSDSLGISESTELSKLSTAVLAKQNAEREKAAEITDLETASIRLQIDSLGLSKDARAIELAVIEAKLNAQKEGIDLSNEEVEQVRAKVQASQDLATAVKKISDADEEAKNAADNWARAQQDVASVIASSFEDALIKGDKLSDVFKSLEEDLLRIATRILITKPLENEFTSLFSNKENKGTGLFSGTDAGGGLVDFFGGLFGGGGSSSNTGGFVNGGRQALECCPDPFSTKSGGVLSTLLGGAGGKGLGFDDLTEEDLSDYAPGGLFGTATEKFTGDLSNVFSESGEGLFAGIGAVFSDGAGILGDALSSIMDGIGSLFSGGGGGGGDLLSGLFGGGDSGGGLFSSIAGLFMAHSGGMVGPGLDPSPRGSARDFVHARRYHSGGDVSNGLLAGERAIIAQDGERVLSKAQARMQDQRGGGGQINMTVVTPDADSFNRSRNQVLSRMQSGLSSASRLNN